MQSPQGKGKHPVKPIYSVCGIGSKMGARVICKVMVHQKKKKRAEAPSEITEDKIFSARIMTVDVINKPLKV